ncbi:MAG TPA: pyrroline-5-carboxylate reductase [Bauldia sp.]|nr:pyrroline-5-carboxylate reductase [Bauldia sp.]
MSLSDAFTPQSPLVLVGVGKMGGAMLAGWLARGLDPKAVVAVDPAPPPDSLAIIAKAGIRSVAAPPPATARVIVIAVKPQIIAGVLPKLRAMIGRDTIILSIAAGATLKNLADGLGEAAIVRSIPNTPAQVARGMTAAIANERVGPAEKALVARLLESIGEVAFVEEESQIDMATAVSGSGPAYVFLLAECLMEAAMAEGASREVASQLARQTIVGAAELLRQSDLPPEKLRENVTSPNGTTAAALAVLMADGGMAALLRKAVHAARKRSEELSG